MTVKTDILQTFKQVNTELSLAELSTYHPQVARRTIQHWVKQLVDEDKIAATGKGRACRYFISELDNPSITTDIDPLHLPVSADNRDILAYIDLEIDRRTPVGYQFDFLPNHSRYL